MSSAFVVALCLLCFIVDPRDYQEVLAAEGVHPHPGPDPQQGVVMQAVETIEEKVQRQKRAEDREQVKGEEKKQRCLSPPLASCESTFLRLNGRGGKKRSKEGSLEIGGGKNKSHKSQETPKQPMLPPKSQPQTQKR